MSAAKYGLPTSLTPGLLEEILRYQPRDWRTIKPRLVRKRPMVWDDLNLSDDDFYRKLHERLKDPTNRQEFDSETRRHDTPKRPRSLYRGMIQFYQEQSAVNESFSEQVADSPSPRGSVDIVSQHDIDRATNMMWLHFAEGHFTDDELLEVAEEHPGVLERLEPVLQGDAVEADMTANRWEACLSRIRDALDATEPKGPDSGLLELLTDCVAELNEILLEAERSSGFSSSLIELMRDHTTVLCERASLKPYVDAMQRFSFAVHVPGDEGDYLNQLGERLRSLGGVVQDILAKSDAISEADAETRGELGKEIGLLSATQERLYSEIEGLLRQVIAVDDGSVDPEPPDAGSHTSSSVVTEGEGHGAGPSPVPQDPSASGPEGAEDDLSVDPSEPDGPDASSESPQSVKEDTRADAALESTVEATEASWGSDATVGDEASEATDATIDERDHGVEPSDTETASVPSDRSETSLEASGEHGSALLGSQALDAMLSSGRFARAYWLTRADHTLGDPDLFGALSEGARIGPGGSCPGALLQFFNGLAGRDRWEDDERLLLGASVLGACLFVDPLPQDIYLLAREFPTDASPVGTLMQRVRELCIHQNAKIRPEDLGVESADAERAARLDRLASDAERFLQRVPHIRFQYKPADFAIQFVYRTGSEWHRLHTIVGGNQGHRLTEVQALLKALDPVEVVANLHDQDELSVLRQPLEGRARDKLVRHLHDTLALAREWTRLAAAAGNGSRSGDRTQSEELLAALKKLLPAARRSLGPTRDRGRSRRGLHRPRGPRGATPRTRAHRACSHHRRSPPSAGSCSRRRPRAGRESP